MRRSCCSVAGELAGCDVLDKGFSAGLTLTELKGCIKISQILNYPMREYNF